MKNRFLSVIIALSLIISCMATSAFAASAFPDVLSPDHDWAAEQIEEMTDLGIIKGYTDGTFKPDKAINKIEALLLFARVAGYSNENYSAIVEFAYDKYQYMLEEIDIEAYNSYKKEIAFLLYKGIFADDEIAAYLEDGQYADEFPRADAAKLLANLMDAKILDVDSSELDFADADDIDDSVAGYIAYVVENGFMNGVAKDDGTVVFDAEAPLSRAQVCVLLYRIMTNLEMSVEAGTVFDIDTESSVIEFENADGDDKSYIIPNDAKIVIDGVAGKLEDVLENSGIVVVRHGKGIYSVEVISPESNKTVKGSIEGVVAKDNYARVSVKLDETGEVVSYYGESQFDVTTDGVADSMKSLKVGDYVVIKLLGTQIVSIDRLTAEATVQGTLKAINLNSPITISVLTVEEISEKETVSEYTVSDEVTIRRDGNKASLRDILVGDKVVLTVKRGDVTKIIATSTKGSATGSVTAIKIAAQSSVTISANGVETEYAIDMNAQYIVAGTEATIYDLRLGNVVTLTLSGSTATKIEQTAASSTTTKSGTVDSISTAYGYINMIGSNAVSEQIFASKTGSTIGAKIINGETGKEITFKNIKKGDYIIATGAYSNGAFIAKTIVVTPVAE
ncbi:MAG: S-layer homology domain-containing protein [Ruminococcaceae bacterium]|nr:S-layer homology domain-containing protein [Oscillospiraceae bacterium]